MSHRYSQVDEEEDSQMEDVEVGESELSQDDELLEDTDEMLVREELESGLLSY